MRYKLLGKSGLRVSELCLGTMTFGEDWGWGASKETSQQMFDMFAEAGGNFIDTANLYTNGTSEEYVGDFIHSDREHFVVATKYTLTPAPNQGDTTSIRPNASGNHRKNMMHAVEASLKRLNTEYIDILYVHAWDFMTPVEEVMRGFDDLVRQGKVTYICVSDTPSWIFTQANMLADLRGWSRFLGVQVPYSLLGRTIERAILPAARQQEMAVLPWGILNAGVLTGKFLNQVNEATRVNPDDVKLSDERLAVVQEVVKIADEVGRTPSQVATNWVRQSPRGQMIPILGVRKVSQLEDNLACLEWELTDEQYKRLDKVSEIKLDFPFTFIHKNRFIYGNTHDYIDNHRVAGLIPASEG